MRKHVNKIDPRGQFHQHSTLSFYAGRSQKCKKDSQVKQLFVLLGPLHVKAGHKHFDEIDPWTTICWIVVDLLDDSDRICVLFYGGVRKTRCLKPSYHMVYVCFCNLLCIKVTTVCIKGLDKLNLIWWF